MNRLIVNNNSSLSDGESLLLVAAVISQGRISDDGLSYYYMNTLLVDGKKYGVIAKLNKGSDSFTIWEMCNDKVSSNIKK